MSVITTCGNAICEAGETFSNCPIDCMPTVLDYLVCVFDKDACQIPNLFNNYDTLFFVIILIIAIIFLRNKGVI